MLGHTVLVDLIKVSLNFLSHKGFSRWTYNIKPFSILTWVHVTWTVADFWGEIDGEQIRSSVLKNVVHEDRIPATAIYQHRKMMREK